MGDAPPTGWGGHLLQEQCRALFDWMASKPDAMRLVRESVMAIEGRKMDDKKANQLINEAQELGAARAWDMREKLIYLVNSAASVERARWKSAIGAVMPADFKDWHQNNDAELPEIAAWVITNLRERVAELEPALDAKDAEIANLREALRRLREWGGIAGRNYSATVAFDVAAWIDAGGKGPLPEAPEYAKAKVKP